MDHKFNKNCRFSAILPECDSLETIEIEISRVLIAQALDTLGRLTAIFLRFTLAGLKVRKTRAKREFRETCTLSVGRAR